MFVVAVPGEREVLSREARGDVLCGERDVLPREARGEVECRSCCLCSVFLCILIRTSSRLVSATRLSQTVSQDSERRIGVDPNMGSTASHAERERFKSNDL